MSDRVEEIRKRVQAFAPPNNDQNVWRSVGFPVSDIRFLLSEIQRLRKVEEAAREVQDMEHLVEITQGRVGAQARKKLAAGLSALSNALEQHIPEPVREEMER